VRAHPAREYNAVPVPDHPCERETGSNIPDFRRSRRRKPTRAARPGRPATDQTLDNPRPRVPFNFHTRPGIFTRGAVPVLFRGSVDLRPGR
jgi:hypothetical protein